MDWESHLNNKFASPTFGIPNGFSSQSLNGRNSNLCSLNNKNNNISQNHSDNNSKSSGNHITKNKLEERRFYGDGSFNDFCYMYEPILMKNLVGTPSITIHDILIEMYSKVPSLMMRTVVMQQPDNKTNSLTSKK